MRKAGNRTILLTSLLLTFHCVHFIDLLLNSFSCVSECPLHTALEGVPAVGAGSYPPWLIATPSVSAASAARPGTSSKASSRATTSPWARHIVAHYPARCWLGGGRISSPGDNTLDSPSWLELAAVPGVENMVADTLSRPPAGAAQLPQVASL